MNTKYQLADIYNGAYGETFETLAEAESALAEAIEEGKKINREQSEDGRETGSDGMAVEDFLSIVEVNA